MRVQKNKLDIQYLENQAKKLQVFDLLERAKRELQNHE